MNKNFQIKVVIGQHNSVALLDCSSAIVSQDIAEIGFGSWWEAALPEVPIDRGEWLIKGKIEEEAFSPEYYDVVFERV